MLICDEFKVNADIGFTYSLEDLSILAYGDRNSSAICQQMGHDPS